MKNRAICTEGWLSKDNLVSFQSFVSLLYSKSGERLFFLITFVHVFLQYDCMCANTDESAPKGDVFPIVIALCCNIS